LTYYNYFKRVGIPIAPTHTLSRDEFKEQIAIETAAGGVEGVNERVVAKILAAIQSEKWGKFIAKPVLGQESKACRTFRPGNNLHKMLTKYVVTTLKKYPGIIFQKFIQGFGKTVDAPEVRSYWVGHEYQFSMVATDKKIYCLAGEGDKPPGRKQNGVMRLPKSADIDTLKDLSRRVIEVLQSKITLTAPGGGALPLLMTRVDMGVMRDGEFKPWVNEVEFVPSYYVEDHTHPIEGSVAHQCAIIAKKFLGLGSILRNRESATNVIPPVCKKPITSDSLDTKDILEYPKPTNTTVSIEDSEQMVDSSVLPIIPVSPVHKSIQSAEPNADMCMDISFTEP